MRGNSHVRFGGRAEETDQPQDWHRASARPNWGRMGRRDVRLEHEPERWVVVARSGGGDGVEQSWSYPDEAQARSMVEHCMATEGDDWRDITQAYHASAESLRRRSEER